MRLSDSNQVGIELETKIMDMLFADQAVADKADADTIISPGHALVAGSGEKQDRAALNEGTAV
jgi:hypothetical protein